jgi:hypothetical protein
MSMNSTTLLDMLWVGQGAGQDDAPCFAVLDEAAAPSLATWFDEFDPERRRLFGDQFDSDYLEQIPHVVRLDPHSGFLGRVLHHGWGRHWGVFMRARRGTTMHDMVRHLHSTLLACDPSDEVLPLHVHDPRVMRSLLPVCDARELDLLLGPVLVMAMEDDDPNFILTFSRDDAGRLHTRRDAWHRKAA